MPNDVEVLHSGFCRVERRTSDGHERVVTTDSVAVLVYLKDTDELIFIEQPRFPLVKQYDNPHGYSIECVAGRIDCEIGLAELVIKEVREEIGVDITADEVYILNGSAPLTLSPGILTERMYLAYVKITSDRLGAERAIYGNQHEGERIRRLRVKVSDLGKRAFDNLTAFALTQWFLGADEAWRSDGHV